MPELVLGRSAVSLVNITKRYPGGVVANDSVSCMVEPGEIHAVLGENGAGKTTLMNILAGLLQPDSGEIRLAGKKMVFRSPRDAKSAGIGMVHQHFSLIPALTVGENLALSDRRTSTLFRPRRWNEFLRGEAAKFGLEIRPDALVWELSMGEKQRVEVFRLLLEGARILILDEPTSILSPHEAENLFKHLKMFKRMGHSILLVTHKIEHVVAFADRVTVLRRGKIIATVNASESTREGLAELMVGRSFLDTGVETEPTVPADRDEVALAADAVTVKPRYCPYGLTNVGFELRAGEILGIAGVSGNGQDELAAAITGLADFDGSIRICGDDKSSQTLARVGYIPGDRMGMGIAGALTIADNLALKSFQENGFSNGPWLSKGRLRDKACELIDEFGVSPSDPDARADTLSGGNVQKVLLARELDRQPEVLVAVTPTAGLDVATVEFVHSKLVGLARNGGSVLLISEDLEELRQLCDRIVVLFEGRVAGTFDRDSMDEREIGLLMSGARENPRDSVVRPSNRVSTPVAAYS